MKSLRLAILALGFVVTTSFISDTSLTDVYICKGPYSKKYHYDKNCRGLSNCSTSIYKITLTDAKQMGRSLCGWED
ncbi:hypothetical protein J1N09_14830 [Aureitalea sp. L0-47]|uniref:hypothetical protein n=1 Tax=Aureitalea sp. L0-47 TaxID=2816962 RepID=UPI00223819F0|nr:hypothetical protein [Aureitalea sp. L0-47]MCW5521121.1 hypothetical protein [Aureitalea sp. L0-47]